LKAGYVDRNEIGCKRGEQESSQAPFVSQIQASRPTRNTPQWQESLQTQDVEGNISQVKPFPPVFGGNGTEGSGVQDLDGAQEITNQSGGEQFELCNSDGSSVHGMSRKRGTTSKGWSPDRIAGSK
jgi:hypothetical protein